MTQRRLALGAWGEELAAAYLKKRGMRILARNVRTPVGEIDIVARCRTHLVFVEVKTRRGTEYGSPLEAVGRRKQRQILRAVQWYLQRHEVKLQPRFDVVGILCQSDEEPQVTHVTDAFSLED